MSSTTFGRSNYLSNNLSNGKAAYLTPEEAAKILRVDRRTVYEWLRSGKLKAVQFGRTWRIPRNSVVPSP